MSLSLIPQAEDSSGPLTLAAHAAFVPIGIVTVLLGPMLPTLSAKWSLNYTQAGFLFTVQFLASTVGVMLSGLCVSRWGFRFAIKAGLLAMAVGVAGLPYSSRILGAASIGIYGLGFGVAVPAANLLVAEVHPLRRSAALNLLNFSWSVGAVACPFLVAAAARAHHVPLLLEAFAGLLFFVALGIAAMPSRIVEPQASRGRGAQVPAIDWRGNSVLLLAALFFLYVGVENSFGGWIASYAKTLGTLSLGLALMSPSFFYSAMMVGRWMASLALKSIEEVALARAGLLAACAGMACLLWSHAALGVMTGATIAGLGLAAVYPITISLLSREFGDASSQVGSVMFTVANLGGAFLPWLVGYSSNRFGSVRVGMVVPLIAAALMCVLYLANWKPQIGSRELEAKRAAS
ncbi:MAG TPA: MFS transporter [Candidatus Sulfotelmatobacter sp.]|nr:MFS transporter [Candidatus Sulfotelmatobacter sp.]